MTENRSSFRIVLNDTQFAFPPFWIKALSKERCGFCFPDNPKKMLCSKWMYILDVYSDMESNVNQFKNPWYFNKHEWKGPHVRNLSHFALYEASE